MININVLLVIFFFCSVVVTGFVFIIIIVQDICQFAMPLTRPQLGRKSIADNFCFCFVSRRCINIIRTKSWETYYSHSINSRLLAIDCQYRWDQLICVRSEVVASILKERKNASNELYYSLALAVCVW